PDVRRRAPSNCYPWLVLVPSSPDPRASKQPEELQRLARVVCDNLRSFSLLSSSVNSSLSSHANSVSPVPPRSTLPTRRHRRLSPPAAGQCLPVAAPLWGRR